MTNSPRPAGAPPEREKLPVGRAPWELIDLGGLYTVEDLICHFQILAWRVRHVWPMLVDSVCDGRAPQDYTDAELCAGREGLSCALDLGGEGDEALWRDAAHLRWVLFEWDGRALEVLSKPEKADIRKRLKRAIAWYRDNADDIGKALPLTLPWVRIPAKALGHLEHCIQEYEAGDLSLRLAEAYVLGTIRNLYRAMKERADEATNAAANSTVPQAADRQDPHREEAAPTG